MRKIIFHTTRIVGIALLFTACHYQPSIKTQGYIEGKFTYISTPVSGALKTLNVARGSQVKQNQVLFTLDEQPEIDIYHAAAEQLKEAIARKESADANLALAKITLKRNAELYRKQAVQKSALDAAQTNYDTNIAALNEASAAIVAAEAKLKQATWQKDQKIQTAPDDGIVFDTYYRLGELVAATQPVLSLLAPANIKAIFYISEPQLSRVKLGDTVSIHCDGCSQVYSAKIAFISPQAEYTPPIIFSNDTNQKFVYRIEAGFPPEEAFNIHPGQPITVTYYPHG